MSEKKINKGKEFKKIHKLQKKLNRSNEKESWLNRKLKQLHLIKLIEKVKSISKRKYK